MLDLNMKQLRLYIIALGLLGGAAPLWAADYYIDQGHPQASDQNPGTEEMPWATLYKAAKAPLQPGDTVFVKKGEYDVSTGGSWSVPAINVPSGAPGKPVTFKSLPRHAAVLDTRNTQGNPAIGVNGNSHVVIDGFVIPKPGNKGIAVFGSAKAPVKDIVLQNNVIHGVFVSGFDNTEGIRLENAQDIIVRNNRIYDVYNTEKSTNASGVKSYKVRNVLIENNVMYDVVAAVKEKENSSEIVVRYNHFYNCGTGLVLNSQNTGLTDKVRYHNNIVECGTGFSTETQAEAPIRDVHVYNNTFSGYSSKALHLNMHGDEFYIYNNIFHRTVAAASMADFFTRQPHTDQIRLMDYNLYTKEPKMIVGLYDKNQITTTNLKAWQGTGWDLHSQLADALFTNVGRDDFRLAANSPALKAGWDANGAIINIGAYATGKEIIGLLPAEGPVAPPRPPRLLAP